MQHFDRHSKASAFHISLAAARRLLVGFMVASTGCSVGAMDEAGEAVEPSVDTPLASKDQALLGSDACRNVDVRIVNQTSQPIKAKSLEFYNVSEGRWQTEDLSNRWISVNAMEFWTPNLQYAENDLISSWNVIYSDDAGNHSYHVNTVDERCYASMVVLLEVH